MDRDNERRMRDALEGLHVDVVPRLALRQREAARSLGMSERTLFDLTKAGEVPHARIGGMVLYPVGLLTDWLRAKAAEKNLVEGQNSLASGQTNG